MSLIIFGNLFLLIVSCYVAASAGKFLRDNEFPRFLPGAVLTGLLPWTFAVSGAHNGVGITIMPSLIVTIMVLTDGKKHGGSTESLVFGFISLLSVFAVLATFLWFAHLRPRNSNK